MVRQRWGTAGIVLALAAGLVVVGTPNVAAVQTPQSVVVNPNPVNWTPHVLDGDVKAIVQVGNTMIAGGLFTSVRADDDETVLTRNNIVAFDATTGAISSSFAPSIGGEVTSLQVAADGLSVYVSGYFSSVNGVTRRYLTRLNVSDGAITSGFTTPSISARVRDMRLVGSRLYIAGAFATVGGQPRPGLAAVSASTGALVTEVNLPFTGNLTGDTSATQVMKIDVTADQSRLVAIGNFNAVAGQPRVQIAMIDITTSSPTLASWRTTRYGNSCASGFDTYVRDLDISPDGEYFVVSTTGAYRGITTLCDTTARWEVQATGDNVQPTWVNYTGGDTTYAVAVTGTAVYVGGHFRWENNPFAGDRAAAGAVPREGIAALDPINGVPFSWNPGRTKGVGVFDMLATPAGLWVVSDTDRIGDFEYHGRVAMFPVAGGKVVPEPYAGGLPNDVYITGNVPQTVDPNYLYRVNAGGPALGTFDAGPGWSADTSGTSTLRNSGSSASTWPAIPGLAATVPSSTPPGVFSSERWDAAALPEMNWNLAVPAGTEIEVRLYFASRCTCTSTVGSRVFDVLLDGSTVLDNYDIVADVGQNVGTMREFDIVSDGNVDIDFGHVVENPLLNAIEVVRIGNSATGPSPGDNLLRRSYDGATVGATTTLSSTGISWGNARGAVMLNGVVYTPWSDGNVYQRTYDGATFGPATALNLYGLTDLANDARNMTGMFYDNGRFYYTISGQSSLFYRYFTPESGIFGAQRFTASGNAAGVSLATVNGMFLSGEDLYYGSSVDQSLRRVGFVSGALTGTATPVSGPAVDGVNWRARSMFLFSGVGATAPNEPPVASATVACTLLSCTASSAGSSDPDGTIDSFAWDFGDGSTAGGPTASHTYAGGGTYTVTLTVTDDDDATASTNSTVTVTPPNAVPVASFTANCDLLACGFDSSDSSDTDGTIVSREWQFGDSTTGSGTSVSRTYAAEGVYTVTLTVTDDDGDSGTTSREVSVSDGQPAQIEFVASAVANANVATHRVTIPASVQAGDGLLLFLSTSTSGAPTASPAGWTQVNSIVGNTVRTTVWRRSAITGDAGAQVSVTIPAIAKGDLTVAAYRGVAANPVAAFAAAGETVVRSAHTTPIVPDAVASAWVVSYWAEKSSVTAAWSSVTGNQTTRSQAFGAGGGHLTSLLTDDNGPAGSPYGGHTATADASSSHATMWTIALLPLG